MEIFVAPFASNAFMANVLLAGVLVSIACGIVGTFGDAEVFSMSGTKPVTSAEGGLFATSDPELAERFRYLRAYGFQTDYHSRYVGLNGKLSELAAPLEYNPPGTTYTGQSSGGTQGLNNYSRLQGYR